MTILFTYSILSAITLTIFYCLSLMLPPSTIPLRLSRRIMLTGYAFSIALPAIMLCVTDIPSWTSALAIQAHIAADTPTIGAITDSEPAHQWHVPKAMLYLNMISVLGILAMTSISAIRIGLLHRRSTPHHIGGITVMVHGDATLAPFSWGRYIFLNHDDMLSPNRMMIVAHEYAHAIHRHWIDILVGSAISALQWYNPMAWLMLRRLRDIHEFQADSYVTTHGTDSYDYQIFLIQKTAGARFASLANSLNHSSLNKRITMMLSKKSRCMPRVRIASAAMLGAIAIGAFSFSGIAQVINDLSTPALENSATSTGKVKDFSLTVNTLSASSAIPNDEIVKEPDVLPQFPGGDAEMMKFLARNVKYPESSMKAGEEGSVVVQFVIDKYGNVTDVTVDEGVSRDLDKEAVRVVRLLPKFTPAKYKGKNVNCHYALPIKFKLSK